MSVKNNLLIIKIHVLVGSYFCTHFLFIRFWYEWNVVSFDKKYFFGPEEQQEGKQQPEMELDNILLLEMEVLMILLWLTKLF